MIDEIYNSRLGEIKTVHTSGEWKKTAIAFEESLTEEQQDIFHKLCDLQSETAADEMRVAYKAGFKDGVVLIYRNQSKIVNYYRNLRTKNEALSL